MKIVCYKAVFPPIGLEETYDSLFEPACGPQPDTEFVIFADVPREYDYKGWRVKPQVFHEASFRRRARHHKSLAHVLFPDATHTLWLDGVFTPLTPPADLVRKYIQEPDGLIIAHRHPWRSCIYQESAAVKKHNKDSHEVVIKQIQRYRNERYPRNNGLAETGALLRKNCPLVSQFNELWWNEIDRGSHRDQLSFNFCLWKMGLSGHNFPNTTRNSPHFQWRTHCG